MPLFDMECKKCKQVKEMLIQGGRMPRCPICGGELIMLPAAWGMLKMKGEGGYPSRRKMVKDTAAYVG